MDSRIECKNVIETGWLLGSGKYKQKCFITAITTTTISDDSTSTSIIAVIIQ